MCFRYFPGTFRMKRVVATNAFKRCSRLINVGERQQPLTDRQGRAETRILDYGRSATRQVALCTITEPATVCADICMLCHAKFCVRTLYVVAVGPQVR